MTDRHREHEEVSWPPDAAPLPAASGGRKPVLYLSFAFAVTLAVLMATVWVAYDSYSRFKAAAEHGLRIHELRGRIIHLDEVLTMSARMAVALGRCSTAARMFWRDSRHMTKLFSSQSALMCSR